MRTDFSFLLLDQLDAPTHRFTLDTVGLLRAEKDAEERQLLKDSAVLNDGAFEKRLCRPAHRHVRGRSARHHHRSLPVKRGAARILHRGLWQEQRLSAPSYRRTDTLQPDMAVLIDAGCRLHGYPSDMTRCAWYGDTPECAASMESGGHRRDRLCNPRKSAALPGTLVQRRRQSRPHGDRRQRAMAPSSCTAPATGWASTSTNPPISPRTIPNRSGPGTCFRLNRAST